MIYDVHVEKVRENHQLASHEVAEVGISKSPMSYNFYGETQYVIHILVNSQ